MYHDLTLRDGSHAIKHKLSIDNIQQYCQFAEDAGISVVEVGHGNGLGASSLLIGESLHSDFEMLRTARKILKNTKLSVHIIPGIATISRDVDQAIAIGVDIFRVASHCLEASMTKSHIDYLVKRGKYVLGVLMMSALCSNEELFEQAEQMKSYGASGIIIMDSTGSFLPSDVYSRIKNLTKLDVPIGFHGHNNLHLAVANSLAAIDAGASIIDVTLRGFGAGAGNTPFEVMETLKPSGKVNIPKVIEYCEKFEFMYPVCKTINLLTAKYKLFSGFEKHIIESSLKYGISIINLVEKLGEHNLVAGQEDLVRVIAQSLSTLETSQIP
jgi:4-hydroxy 2-oxovalerate aldolase